MTTTSLAQREKTKLEIVLKCDSAGSQEAVAHGLEALGSPDVEISVIHSGVGIISKSDVLFAETAGKLIVGFQVGVMPLLDKVLRERGVEVRLYDVIYRLLDDIKAIAVELAAPEPGERIIGSGRIIALFKSARKGIIVGCEVSEGFFAVNERFRIISAMGPVYTGVIESLHIGNATVRKAPAGSQAGIRIKHFSNAKVGDIVESFRPPQNTEAGRWKPEGRIIKK